MDVSRGYKALDAKPRILVGIDFSEGASLALSEARWLMERLGAALDLVFVDEGRDGDGHTGENARSWLERESIAPETVTVRRGFPWLELARRARETSPALVVVGSHGRSGFQPLSLGSTAARLGVSCPSPVLVVTMQNRRGLLVSHRG
jgi:nucleotide-binding universal stress UspA family protein